MHVITPGTFNSKSLWAACVAALLGAVVLWLASRSIFGHAPLYDEMLHVTAAQGVIATGEPIIADGRYPRAELFTRLVAASFESQGVSMEAARTPALIAGMLLVALLGAWVTRHAGLMAGVSAAVLLASVPSTIQLAAFARFYTLHGLFILCAAIAAYESVTSVRSTLARAALAVVALAFIAVALHLQPTTVVATGAGILATATVLLYDHWNECLRYFRAHRSVLLASAFVLAAIAVVLFWKLDLLSMAGEAPLWAEGRAMRIQFYLVEFANDMPLFWPMLLPAAFLGLLVRPRLTAYCIVFFLSAIAAHSVAAAKDERYVYYTLPFMFAVWGIAVAGVYQQIAGIVATQFPTARLLGPVAGLAVLAFVVLSSQEMQRTVRLLTGRALAEDAPMFLNVPDWSLTLPALRPLAAAADLKIVSSGVKGIYYLGDYDYEINSSVVLESESGEEFGRDSRTGRKVISTARSLNEVLDNARSALVVIERMKLGTKSGVPAASVALLADRCKEIELPVASAVAAWSCQH